jgi:uncharacterized protein (UPF0548 family)
MVYSKNESLVEAYRETAVLFHEIRVEPRNLDEQSEGQSMWYFRKPSDDKVRDFLERQKSEPFTYVEVGFSRDGSPKGYELDHNRVLLGEGQAVFEAACAALRRWEMFPAPWTKIHPAESPIQEGMVVALRIRLYGLWWLIPCRIVYVLDESQPCRRFGFAYGTLPAHVECGEERFSIEWLADNTVWYDLRAFSRPRYWPARLAYPLTRSVQKRFIRESQGAMRKAALQA